MSESGIVLEARELWRRYRMGSGVLEVLRGASLALRPGEVVALRGASGSGKSTLLHLLGLLDRPDRGEVRLAGRAAAGLGATARARLRARLVGFVFQQFHLLAELSALENVLVPRRLACGAAWLRRRREERARARELLAAVGLGDRLRHRPAQLSGGEQQRVAIARALVGRPAILLADEPTGNLDRRTGEEVLALLLELARDRDAAVLLATHDPDIAARCDRILALADGRIEAE
ncbi:MAG: ATP-binding cassette domain-containing protein [Planctomycetota bacterium]|nr:MAG: ATP-binding cassette domain-containing protein [Planctomycetota bacterium]